MTPAQKLALRASDIRSRLAVLGGMDDINEEQTAELATLRSEYTSIETRSAALLIADDKPAEPVVVEKRSEDREMSALIEGASIGSIFNCAIEKRATDGQTAELQTELKLAGNQIPLALLLERRAAGVTNAPSDVGQNQAEIIPAVFPQSCAEFLGIDMPTVGVGEAIYPVLTTGADVGLPAEHAAQAETQGAFTADVLSPSRLQAAFHYSREDRARFMGMDSALRQNLSEALADKFDQQILGGTGGLFTGTILANHNVSAVTEFADYMSDFGFGRVDGKYASGLGDIKMVMGAGTFGHAGTRYANTNKGDLSAIEKLAMITAGVKVSAHVPAVSGNKQNAVIRLGMRRDMVAPIWEGVTLVVDEVTQAAKGQLVITAIMLHAIKLLRSDGFYKQQSQHA